MSLRGLLIGSVILFVLAGGVYWSVRQDVTGEDKGASDSPKLVSIKDESVQRVEILRRAEPPVILERDASKKWKITAPQPLRADNETVSSLVSTFTGLTQDRLVDEKASDFGQFGLAEPAVQIGVTADGKKRVLSIGDETPTSNGFFARLDGEPKVFTIVNGSKTSLDKTANDLRDKRLLTFDENKLAKVDLIAKGQAIEFGKNAQGDWQIVKPRPLRADNFAVEEMVRKVKDARMEIMAGEDAQAAASKFAAGVRVAVVNTTDAAGTQTLEIKKSREDYFAKSSATEGIYKVAKDLGDGVDKGLDDFRNKKLFDFGYTDPNKLDIRDGAKKYSFVKGGEKWWSNGKEMDPTSVQSLIDKLRDASATKLAEAGFTTPELELTVTSNEGKRVERVQVAKAGAAYFAKRENDATIYELDSQRVEEIQRAAADVKAPPPPPPAKK